MGRSQVLYNRTKAKMRRGRDGSGSILSELTDPSALHPPPHHSLPPHPPRWNDPDMAAYSESEPSVSITESMQQQLQVEETVDRLLMELPSATSAYAQSYASRSRYTTTSRSSLHHHHERIHHHDTNASLASLEDPWNASSTATEVLHVELLDACLQQELTLAERLHIPQHLMDAIAPDAPVEDSDSVISPSDDILSVKSEFNERLQRAMTGDERIMAARSPSPSPTRRRLDTISPRNANPATPRSLLPAPSDENSILDHDALMNEPSSSSSSESDGKDDLILASRQSSDDDDDEDETLQLIGSVKIQEPSLSTAGTSTLAGERILDQPMMRRSLLTPFQPPSQPMQTTNEKRPESVVAKSTTAIEGVLKLHRASVSPPRESRGNSSPQPTKPVPNASPPRERTDHTPASPASLRMRNPLQVHTERYSTSNQPAAQFVSEDMTAISSVGLQSIRDDPRLPPPPPATGNANWAPKPGESFEIKTVSNRGRGSSPRSTPKTVTPKLASPSATPVASNKASSISNTKQPASPPTSPKTKPVSEKSSRASPSLSSKQHKLVNRIRSLSPPGRQQPALSTPSPAKKNEPQAKKNEPLAKKSEPPKLKINTNVYQDDKKQGSKSPSRASTPTRAQLYPIHDVSITAPKQGNASQDNAATLETSKLPSNEHALLDSVGLGSQRRGRSLVRRPVPSKPTAKRPSTGTHKPVSHGADDDVNDNTSANTSAMLSSIHLLEDCDTVPGIEVTDRKVRALQKSSGRGGAGSFSYQGDADLSPAKSRASDIATYVEDASNQGLEIKRKATDRRNKTPSPIRVTITSKQVPKSSRDKLNNNNSSPQRQMVDVIDLSAVDSASLSPSRIIKAIRTGQSVLKRDKSTSPTKPRDTNRPLENERTKRRSKSPRHNKTMDEWLDSALKSGSGEGIEVEDVGELNDWLDSVIT